MRATLRGPIFMEFSIPSDFVKFTDAIVSYTFGI